MSRNAVLFALLAAASFGMTVAAQEDPGDEAERAKLAAELVAKAADSFTFETIPARGERVVLKRVEQPVQKFSDTESGSVHGAIFVWTVDDRPQLVASIFKFFSPHTFLDAEFHSLSEEPLKGVRGEKVAWNTGKRGVTFLPLEGTPATSAPRRLAHMREELAAMSAQATNRTGVKSELRLLEKPLHRFAAPKAGVVDGALFAFVRGTDPEILAQIEAKQNAAGALEWQVGFAQMNSWNMSVARDGKTLYEVKELPWDVVFNGRELYNIVRVDGKRGG